MRQSAAGIEAAHFTSGHPAYRKHLETERLLVLDIALLLMEDSGRTADWHRQRSPGRGLGHWLHKFFLTLRLRSHGKSASEALMEAAKSVVRQAEVHQEYMAVEARKNSGSSNPNSTTTGGSGRYRTR
jgi:hypothetical protein